MSTPKRATDAEVGRMHRQLAKLFGLVEAGKRSYDDIVKPLVQAAIEDKKFVPPWYDYAKLFIHGWFTPPELQVANLRVLNKSLSLGINDGLITGTLGSIPGFDWESKEYRRKPLTLCFTLATLEETFVAQLSIMNVMYGGGKAVISDYRRELLKPSRQLRITEGAPEFVPDRIWWEVVDLDAYRGRGTWGIEPKNVPVATAASTQVLDALCQHSSYFLAQTRVVDELSPHVRFEAVVRGLEAKGSEDGYDLLYVSVHTDGGIEISTRPSYNSPGRHVAFPMVVAAA